MKKETEENILKGPFIAANVANIKLLNRSPMGKHAWTLTGAN